METPQEHCLPITGEDFEDIVESLDAPLRKVRHLSWHEIASGYQEAAKDANEKGAEKLGRFYRSIAILYSFHPNFDNAHEPYTAAFIFEDRRSAVPGDLTKADLDTVAAVRLKTKEPILSARLGDLLWVRRRDHAAANDAGRDFLIAGRALLNKENWFQSVGFFHRALQLGHWLGRKNQTWVDAEKATVEALQNELAETEPFYAAHFLGILIQIRAGDAAMLADVAQHHAEKALAEKQPSRSRDYRHYEADLWRRDKNAANESIARIEAAKTYELEADQWVNGDKPSYFAASGLLIKGIEALRQAKGDPAEVDRLRKKAVQYQSQTKQEMQVHEHRFDISAGVEQAVKQVTVSDFREALRLLSFSVPLINPKKLREAVLNDASESVWASIVDTSLVDNSGRVTANLGNIPREGGTNQEANIENRMFRRAADIDWPVRAEVFIEPARRQVWSQHLPTQRDFNFLVLDNPFVPPGHEGIFRRGLYHGLQGDFLLSSHLLTPQVENSIRYVLEQRGVDVSNLNSDLTQPVKLLGPLLDISETKRFFGEELHFEFRGLLIEKTGYSFRNDIAHGFLQEINCYGPGAQNLWWLVLRICYSVLILSENYL